ncbi:hypothetical protein OIU76_019816 [Salix suchowensis]|nr:hypothetical protein OIU76_019816 [Salix suchowensis]
MTYSAIIVPMFVDNIVSMLIPSLKVSMLRH